VHEAGKSGGVGNNIAGEVGRRSFEYLEAPIGLVSGWEWVGVVFLLLPNTDNSTPVPLTFERFYQPDVIRVLDKLIETLSY